MLILSNVNKLVISRKIFKDKYSNKLLANDNDNNGY
jgi:hypothetical protein